MSKRKYRPESRRLRIEMKEQLSLLGIFLALLCQSCAPADIDIELPAYEKKVVVEAYLVPDEPLVLTLYESVPYFDEPELPILPDAQVTLSYGSQVDTLEYRNNLYQSLGPIPRLADTDYLLSISLPDGRQLSASTYFIDPVPIDSLTWSRDPGLYWRRVSVYFSDPTPLKNYYRLTVKSFLNGNHWDVESDDDLVQGESITFFSGAIFEPGDSAIVRLYNATPEYYEFLASLRKAQVGSAAPVVEPSALVSNVEGGTGIFTSLNVSTMGIKID